MIVEAVTLCQNVGVALFSLVVEAPMSGRTIVTAAIVSLIVVVAYNRYLQIRG